MKVERDVEIPMRDGARRFDSYPLLPVIET